MNIHSHMYNIYIYISRKHLVLALSGRPPQEWQIEKKQQLQVVQVDIWRLQLVPWIPGEFFRIWAGDVPAGSKLLCPARDWGKTVRQLVDRCWIEIRRFQVDSRWMWHRILPLRCLQWVHEANHDSPHNDTSCADVVKKRWFQPAGS